MNKIYMLDTNICSFIMREQPEAVLKHLEQAVHGGERGALLYGLIGTCRLNGIDPEAYLRHILSVLPE